MGFRSHRFRILIRIFLIAVFTGTTFYALGQEKWYAATIVSALIVLLLLIELFRFIDRTNLEFINILQSIKYQDFTRTYRSKYNEKTFRELETTFNEILSVYKEAKIDQVAQNQYLQIVLEHIRIGLICFNEKADVILVNRAAARFFRRSEISSLHLLKDEQPELYHGMMNLHAGERELIRITTSDEILRLAVTATELKIREDNYKLVSLQDIRQELEEQELDSWQKLIRVLTHEIMNSVTPVSSLSEAINEMLIDEQGRRRQIRDIDEDDLDDMYKSLETIEERSKGLLRFVQDYKNLTRLPRPEFETLRLEELFMHMEKLFARDMETAEIIFTVNIPGGGPVIQADPQMMHQVLINLINNAMEAVSGKADKAITLEAEQTAERTCIRVSDNGRGIDPENADKVFIPFFTTRKKGSGIGLSLSRQIMRLHKGTIYFHTDGGGTVFTLEFS